MDVTSTFNLICLTKDLFVYDTTKLQADKWKVNVIFIKLNSFPVNIHICLSTCSPDFASNTHLNLLYSFNGVMISDAALCQSTASLIKTCFKRWSSHLFLAKPHWLQAVTDTALSIEENLFWECKANGKPKPSYSWLKNGDQVMAEVRGSVAFLTVILLGDKLKVKSDLMCGK